MWWCTSIRSRTRWKPPWPWPHERITLWQSLERGLGYAASALEGGFGFFQYFLHPNHRTVHDRIAETIVLAERGPAARSAGAGAGSPAS